MLQVINYIYDTQAQRHLECLSIILSSPQYFPRSFV